MQKCLSLLILATTFLLSISAIACDETAGCGKCAKAPEFSWNPSNRDVTPRLDRFYHLEDEIKVAYQSNDYDNTRELAKEYLDLATVYRCNWNYGNAIHDANRILGWISLKEGDVDSAAAYLLKAGKSTGSPQLDSFGPEFDLANALLKKGQTVVVKTYLKEVKSFWEMDDGRIDTWLAQLDNGEKPELSRFSASEPTLQDLFLYWGLIAWPAIVSVAVLCLRRKRIARKFLFLMAAAGVGYIVMILAGSASGYGIYAFLSHIDTISVMTVEVITYLPTGITLLMPVLAVFFVERFFRPKIY